jgi:protease-4
MKTFWKVLIVLGVFVFIGASAGLLGYLVYKMGSFGDSVYVVPVKGFITLDECGGDFFSSSSCTTVSDVKEAFEEAEADVTVKAIILDVNSGGGSVVASREMMRVVKSSGKPVVAWVGEAGASGAYYVASAADYIVADRDSIMGSIGVIAEFMHYYGLMDKVGFNVTVIKSGKTKDMGSPYRPMTEEEKELMQGMVDQIYVDFVSDVAENRGLSQDFVENVSRGQVYLGSEALTLGLVDAVGGFDDAVSVAKNLGGIEGEPNILRPERTESLLEMIEKLYGFKYIPFYNIGYRNFLAV